MSLKEEINLSRAEGHRTMRMVLLEQLLEDIENNSKPTPNNIFKLIENLSEEHIQYFDDYLKKIYNKRKELKTIRLNKILDRMNMTEYIKPKGSNTDLKIGDIVLIHSAQESGCLTLCILDNIEIRRDGRCRYYQFKVIEHPIFDEILKVYPDLKLDIDELKIYDINTTWTFRKVSIDWYVDIYRQKID